MKQHHGNQIFVDNIKALRRVEGLTQETFATAIGVSRTLVGAWEEGRSMPTAVILAKIAFAFGITDLPSFITKPYDLTNPNKLYRNVVGDLEAKFNRLSRKNKQIVKLILDGNP